MQAMPDLFSPSKTLLKQRNILWFLRLHFPPFCCPKASSVPPSGQGQITIEVQTWDQINNSGNDTSDPGGSTTLLKGINAAGSSAATLCWLRPVGNGDLIELVFKLDDGTANTSATDLFAGTWSPSRLRRQSVINSTRPIGLMGTTRGILFGPFSRDSLNAYSANANINVQSDSGHEITNDTPSGLVVRVPVILRS